LDIVDVNRGTRPSSRGECDVFDLDPQLFILHFASQLCIASKLVCSLLEAMAGSLSVAITAVSSAKVDDVSGEIRSAVNRR
jgi:hypothetical protein